MQDYDAIKNILKNLTDTSYGGDAFTYASVVSEEVDDCTNDYYRNMNYDIIACVALKEGRYDVYKVSQGYAGGPDYLILGKGYDLKAFEKHWENDIEDLKTILRSAVKMTCFEDIVKPD